MRLTRILGAFAAVAVLALPSSPAQAVNTPVYTFVLDCATGSASTGDIWLPSGRYVVTVAGACSFAHGATGTIPVDTCVNPLTSLPCVSTGANVNGVPSTVCVIGVGIAYEQICNGWSRGVYLPSCYTDLTVVVNEQCLTTVPHTVGVINHGGGAMTARVADNGHFNNLGAFTVTAVWTPL